MANDPLPICLIRPTGSAPVVTLAVDNALLSGSDFGVWAADGATSLETWQMSAGTDGSVDREVRRQAAALDGCFLTWEVRVCAPHAAIEEGTVTVLVRQDGALLHRRETPVREVPQCTDGRIAAIPGGVAFRLDGDA